QSAARDRLVQPYGREAPRPEAHRGPRPENREPAARAGVCALPAASGVRQPGDYSPREPRGVLPLHADRALWRRPAIAARRGRVAADAPRGGTPRLRRQRLARAALAAYRDRRLPRDTESGSGARPGARWAGRGNAPAGGAHDGHHSRSARALASGADG